MAGGDRTAPVVAIVQARMGSTRLPGKVLEEIAGKPMVQRVLERTWAAEGVGEVRLATSRGDGDDPLVRYVERNLGVPVIRGSERDVLGRYRRACDDLRRGTIVRVTADCPLIDPDVIDRVLGVFRHRSVEYASNINPPTFPDGLDVEVLDLETLRRLHDRVEDPKQREHVTLHLRRNPDRYATANLRCAVDRSDERWTVDYPEDLTFVRRVYERMQDELAGMDAVLDLLRRRPALRQINAGRTRGT